MRAGFSMPPGFDWIIVLEKNTTVFFFFLGLFSKHVL
jgi:hypothetical protein